MHGKGVLTYAFGLVKDFLEQNYWSLVAHKIHKRDGHLAEFQGKLKSYSVIRDSKYKLPLFSEMKAPDERLKVLSKFTKANLKLNKQLDGT